MNAAHPTGQLATVAKLWLQPTATDAAGHLPIAARTTLYLDVRELAVLLHHAQVCGSTIALLTDKSPLAVVAGVVPLDTLALHHASANRFRELLSLAVSSSAPEGRRALTWGRLSLLVIGSWCAGSLFALALPYRLDHVMEGAERLGFPWEQLLAAIQHVQRCHRSEVAVARGQQ